MTYLVEVNPSHECHGFCTKQRGLYTTTNWDLTNNTRDMTDMTTSRIGFNHQKLGFNTMVV